jgi:hypothetical protein
VLFAVAVAATIAATQASAERSRIAQARAVVQRALDRSAPADAQRVVAAALEATPDSPPLLELADVTLGARLDDDERRAAAERTRAADAALEAASRVRARAEALAREVEAQSARLRERDRDARPHDPLRGPEKVELARTRALLDAASIELARARGEVIAALGEGLARAPAEPRLLAERARAWAARARDLGAVARDLEIVERARAEGRARASDEAAARTELTGDAELSIETEPAGAEASIDGEPRRMLGRTPIVRARVPAGLLGVVLQHDLCREIRIDLRLQPGETASARARLPSEREIEVAEIPIPGGAVRAPPPPLALAGAGTDGATSAVLRAFSELPLRPCFVSRRLVRMSEYADFLDALPKEQAVARRPRDGQNQPLDSAALRAHGAWPVVGVTLDDGRSYAAWRASLRRASSRGGLERLPARDEVWAARARGADASSVREWTTSAVPGVGIAVDARSESGAAPPLGRDEVLPADARATNLGFRLARDLPETP